MDEKSRKLLHEMNKLRANEIYDSAFYYGNFTEYEWIDCMTRLLDEASANGYNLNFGDN